MNLRKQNQDDNGNDDVRTNIWRKYSVTSYYVKNKNSPKLILNIKVNH